MVLEAVGTDDLVLSRIYSWVAWPCQDGVLEEVNVDIFVSLNLCK